MTKRIQTLCNALISTALCSLFIFCNRYGIVPMLHIVDINLSFKIAQILICLILIGFSVITFLMAWDAWWALAKGRYSAKGGD